MIIIIMLKVMYFIVTEYHSSVVSLWKILRDSESCWMLDNIIYYMTLLLLVLGLDNLYNSLVTPLWKRLGDSESCWMLDSIIYYMTLLLVLGFDNCYNTVQ